MAFDVVMPQMNGPALVKELRCVEPDIKVLFMSGYPDEAIAHHGVLDPGVALLQKPFAIDELLERVGALDVAVAAGIASGNIEEARQAAAELRSIADRVGTVALAAHADSAEARLADDATAVERWQDAIRRFHLAGLAFDEADARLQLAAVLRRTGDAQAPRGAHGGIAESDALHATDDDSLEPGSLVRGRAAITAQAPALPRGSPGRAPRARNSHRACRRRDTGWGIRAAGTRS